MPRYACFVIVLAACFATGCRADRTEQEPPPIRDETPVLSFSTPAPEASADQGCDCQHGSPEGADDVRTHTDPSTGQPVQAVGGELTGAKSVTVAELSANPQVYAGQTVALAGDVFSMCVHRRAWFALRDPGDTSGTYVRIITAPGFRVPEGAIGKQARAEGQVELIEVPARQARHYARKHGLGDGGVDAPVKAVVVRATGAEFN